MTALAQREPRQECPAFLALLRRKPCCACGHPAPSQAAHIRMASPEHGKRSTGMAEKPSDRWCLPLCQSCHLDAPEAQHRIGEVRFWKAAGIDPFAMATKLWETYCRRSAQPPELRRKVKRRAATIARKTKSTAKIKSRGFAKGKTLWPKRTMTSRT